MKRNPDPIFEASHIKAVPVIASFDSNGNIVPLYVSLKGERYRIAQTRLDKEDNTFTYFDCSIIEGIFKKDFQFIYNKSHHAWFIPVEYLKV